MWRFENLRDLKDAVEDAREGAVREAEDCAPCAFSRGTFLATADLRGDQCSPSPEADCPGWRGTWKEIVELVNDVQANHPHVGEVYISGGYDGAESPRDYRDDIYEPWVSSWLVSVWKRDK